MLERINRNSGVMGLIAILVLVANLLLSQLGGVGQIDPLIEQGATNFDVLQVGDGSASETAVGFTADTDLGLYRSGANTLEIAAGGSSIVTVNTSGLTADSLTSSSGFTISDGNLVVADWTRFVAQTAISVTNGATFTPTGSYQPLTSAGNVTPTLSVTGFTAGYLLMLVNNSNTSILIPEAGSLIMAGNVTLGQYDNITFLFDGTRWVERARVNN